MALYTIHLNREVKKSEDTGDEGLWILALGGAGIGVGLCLYGYQIIRAIGVKLAVITPPRGATIEFGSAIVVIFGSYLGLPLSTTHCQVGSTTGVALFEGTKGVNGFLLLKTVIGWIITLIICGVTTGIIVAWGINSPLSDGKTDILLDELCPTWATAEGWIQNSTNI